MKGRLEELNQANRRINTALDGIGAAGAGLHELANIAHQLRIMEHHIRARLAHVEALMQPLLDEANKQPPEPPFFGHKLREG